MTDVFCYNGIPIRYTDTGSGPIVVLLHGFAEIGEVWRYQVDSLQKSYRVIIPEIPGTDWLSPSSAIADLERQTDLSELTTPLYELPVAFPQTREVPLAPPLEGVGRLAGSIDAMAEALAALIQKVTNEPVVLLGHSMGGYITLAFAEKYPQLLKAFGLIHSTAFADTEEKKATRRKGIEFIRLHGSEAFFKTAAPGLFSQASKQKVPELVDESVAMAAGYAPEILVANYEAMMARPNRTAVLSGSGVSVLFIIGKEDKAAPAADVLQQVHLPTVSYFHLLEGVAHMGMWEAPDEVNNLIAKFLEDCA